ncbi:MAG: phosphatidate cytidylyltransferase [Actinobacteria bacterium]|nr:phosphatidate cytidylyltransferase [Actinomycetota bacterium]MCL6104714.1 phosphatidate cytidylyltransferase [Actinomycetota bacterium]
MNQDDQAEDIRRDQPEPDSMLPHWTDPPTGQVPAILIESFGESDLTIGEFMETVVSSGTETGWKEVANDWDDLDPIIEPQGSEEFLDKATPEEIRPEGIRPEGIRPGEELVGEKATGEEADHHKQDIRSKKSNQTSRGNPHREKYPRRTKKSKNPVVAIVSGFAFGILALIVFWLGPLATMLFCLVVVLLGAAETYASMREAGYRPATLLGLLAVVFTVLAAFYKGETAVVAVVGAFIIFMLLWYLSISKTKRIVANVSVTFFVYVWIGVLGSFAGLLLNPAMFPGSRGVAIVFGAVLGVIAYDVGAYVSGSMLGKLLFKSPLAPNVSPGKTWEGLLGGMISSIVICAAVVSQVSPWTLSRALLLGVVAAVLAPLGDLCESLVKRDLHLKDMGSIMPGHGGILDRVDALLFVLPATYYLARLLKMG